MKTLSFEFFYTVGTPSARHINAEATSEGPIHYSLLTSVTGEGNTIGDGLRHHHKIMCIIAHSFVPQNRKRLIMTCRDITCSHFGNSNF